MEIFSSEKIRITQKYGLGYKLVDEISFEERKHLMMGDLGQIIYINDVPYEVLTPSYMVRENLKTEDGKYHFIYIQINIETCEYYIGKVNRERWSSIKKYQGSGLKFVNKYNKHKEQFVRYYILSCMNGKESEEAEARVVTEDLLQDPFCLNLVCGGGGTTHHSTEERNQKIREYMIAHPERYQKMIERSKELFQSGKMTHSLQLRSERIKQTMSDDKYREMISKRIKNWMENNPEAYAKARENNKLAIQSEESKSKRNASLKKWRTENAEQYQIYKDKLIEAQHSPEAEKKRSESLKEYHRKHPEAARKRSEASVAKCSKPVNMIDIETGEILRSFGSQQEASLWLVSEGKAKNTNCKTSISSVCLKRYIPGHGVKKTAYGYKWEFMEKE